MKKEIDKILNCYLNNEQPKKYEIKNYDLTVIQKILSLLENPQESYPCIHVAGTNGKGSTVFYTDYILQTKGLQTGRYTSPHLLEINERIAVNHKLIQDEELLDFLKKIEKINKSNSIKPSFFELLTACSFQYFQKENVDVGIIETGLGGRLDSTNIIKESIALITDISLDHTAFLGDNLTSIAHEKAGIIKKNCTVATTNQAPQILSVLTKKAKEMNSQLLIFNQDFFVKNIKTKNGFISYDYNYKDIKINNIKLKTVNQVQIRNSALAITGCIELAAKYNFDLSTSEIKEGIFKTCIPARFEQISKKPIIFYDPAHNEQAFYNLLKNCSLITKNQNNFKIILSLMKDKDSKTIISLLKKHFPSENIIYYELAENRAASSSEIKNKYSLKNFNSLNEITDYIYKNSNNCYLFCGSFYLYRDALKIAEILKTKANN